MTFTLNKLATLTNSSVHGDNSISVDSVASISEAKHGQITFYNNSNYLKELNTCKASAVILTKKHATDFNGNALINENPYLTFAKVLQILHSNNDINSSISDSAIISESSQINKDVCIRENVVIDKTVRIDAHSSIGAGTYVGENVTIGKGSIIHPNVTIYANTKIGENCIIHSGTVIGADGFGFAPYNEKQWFKILQIGNVIIGNNVEIGANTTIDCATLGSTIINDGVKLDNQIHLGHNVTLGKHTAMAAGTVVGGSTEIGKYCQIGGGSAISGHLKITDDVIITGKSMVVKSITKSGMYSSGMPVEKNRTWRRNITHFKQFDKLVKRLKALEKKVSGE